MRADQRAHYLQVLGIDLWVPRSRAAPATAGAPAAEPAAPAEPAARPAAGLTPTAAPAAEPAPPAEPAPRRERALQPELEQAWAQLRAEVAACTRCPLHATRTQGVLGVGDRRAEWLIVGEAPGAEEDRQGEPFVGRAGQLLDSMLRAIGLARGNNVYIANVLKSRPPANRDPRPEEVASCLPYLRRQVELIRPRLILAVGRIAAQNLLATDAPLARLRGRAHRFGELNTPLVVTYHPAYLLRTPADKRKAWEDLKFARELFRRTAAAPERL